MVYEPYGVAVAEVESGDDLAEKSSGFFRGQSSFLN